MESTCVHTRTLLYVRDMHHSLTHTLPARAGCPVCSRRAAHEAGETEETGGNKGQPRLLPQAQDEEEGQGGAGGASHGHEDPGADAVRELQ